MHRSPPSLRRRSICLECMLICHDAALQSFVGISRLGRFGFAPGIWRVWGRFGVFREECCGVLKSAFWRLGITPKLQSHAVA